MAFKWQFNVQVMAPNRLLLLGDPEPPPDLVRVDGTVAQNANLMMWTTEDKMIMDTTLINSYKILIIIKNILY